jgi:transcription elongation factor GreA
LLTEVKRKLEEEMQRIEHELRVTLPLEIQTALGQGDLSENAEYDVTGVPKDRAGLGSEVTVENLESGEEVRYTVVIPELADGNKSFVSMASPVGKALMNRRVGDTVTITIPRGTLEYEVRRIVTLTGDVLE